MDGNAATFISHTGDTAQTLVPINDAISNAGPLGATGTLLTKDGTRYLVAGGLISKITDHNGNYFTFTYDANSRPVTIVDSLGRTVSISYGNANDSTFGDATWKVDIITYTGTGGNSRSIKVYTAPLDKRLLSGTTSSRTALFSSLTCNNPVDHCDYSSYDPQVYAKVVYPNGDAFDFLYNAYGEVAQVTLPTGGVYQYDWNLCPNDVSGCGSLWGSIPYQIYIDRHVNEKRIYASAAAVTAGTPLGKIDWSTGLQHRTPTDPTDC